MAGQLDPRPQPQRPPDDPWPALDQAGAGSLHLDAEQLMRSLRPLADHTQQLASGHRGGLDDARARLGVASTPGAWGTWMNADRMGRYHATVTADYLASCAELLDQLARLVQLTEDAVRTTTTADSRSGAAFAEIRREVEGLAPASQPPPGPDATTH
jgi:hypothetical protein